MASSSLTIVLWLASLGLVPGFIFDGPCFTPCKCLSAYFISPTVDCSNHSLTAIPDFDEKIVPFDRDSSSWKVISLKVNQIKSIPTSAFLNLGKLYPGNTFTIDLSANQISHIDQNAFDGLENITLRLNLRGNLLTSLPVAFMNVDDLKYLDMTNNPLHTLNAAVMNHLAPNLKQFLVSMDHFNVMPNAIGLLRTMDLKIKGFTGTNLNGKILNDDYVEELKELSISNSSITDASAIPCRFSMLDKLFLFGNYRLHNSPFGNCQPRGPLILDRLKIEWSNLTSFKMSIYRDVSWLSLRGNLLDRVPETVSTMANIVILNLGYNRITHVTNTDFRELTILSKLYLEYNPLTTIDDRAFSTIGTMSLLLRGTDLTTYPDAIFGHTTTFSLVLPDTLQCTCTSMANLVGHTLPDMFARCANNSNMTVSDFVNTQLPKCP